MLGPLHRASATAHLRGFTEPTRWSGTLVFWLVSCAVALALGLGVGVAPWLTFALACFVGVELLSLTGRIEYSVALVTVAAVLFASIPLTTPGPLIFLPYVATACLIATVGVLELVDGIERRRVSVGYAVASLGFAWWALASTTWSTFPNLSKHASLGLILLMLATAVIVPSAVAAPRDVARIVKLLGAVVSSVAAIGFVLSQAGIVPSLSPGRYEGVLGNPNSFGYLAAPILAPLVIILSSERHGKGRGWLLLEASIIVIGIVLSGSRAGLIASASGVAVAAVALAWVRQTGAARRLACVVLIGFLVGYGALAALDRPLRPGEGGFFSELGTGSGRTNLWDKGLSEVHERVALGTGFGTAALTLNVFEAGKQLSVHNSFLELAIELGVPGALWLFLLVGSGAVAAWSVARRAGPWQLTGVVLLGGVVACAVEAQFEAGLVNISALIAFPFWLLVGLAHSIRFRRKHPIPTEKNPSLPLVAGTS